MKTLLPLSFLAAGLALVGSARAQNYAIDWFTIDGGGGTSTGGVFSLSGTIGQPDAGTVSGGTYSLAGGFWGILTTLPTSPLLTATNDNGTITICWPRPADGFLLEQAGALSSPPASISWNTVSAATYQTNATRIFITVPMPGGKAFYRLRRP